jgi:hypothetical protein
VLALAVVMLNARQTGFTRLNLPIPASTAFVDPAGADRSDLQ